MDEIPATLKFVDETGERVPGSETAALSAKLMATGFSWGELELKHTGGLDMDRDELADLISDAYREGTVMENEAMNWESLSNREWMKEMASHTATCVLKGPATAMEDLMEQHLLRFSHDPLPLPGEEARAQVSLTGGKLTMTFTPGA